MPIIAIGRMTDAQRLHDLLSAYLPAWPQCSGEVGKTCESCQRRIAKLVDGFTGDRTLRRYGSLGR